MAKKVAVVLFRAIYIGIIFSVLSFGWYWVQSYMILRSAIGVVASKVAEEGCLASEAVYKSSSGGYFSTQDSIKSYLEGIDDANWFLEFDTSNVVGGKASSSAVQVYYKKGNSYVTANSYTKAANRGTEVKVTLRATLVMTLNFAPEVNGSKLTMRIPVSYSMPVIASGYYKGTDDNREY